MKRSAKILCAFGSILIVLSIIVLFAFEHTPYPWGVATMGGGLGDETALDQTMLWQAHVFISTVGAGVGGIAFLLAAGAMFLISKFKSTII